MMMRGRNFMYLRGVTAVAVEITHDPDFCIVLLMVKPTDYHLPSPTLGSASVGCDRLFFTCAIEAFTNRPQEPFVLHCKALPIYYP